MIATDGLDLFDSLGRLADLAGQANDLREVLDRAVLMIAETTDADLCLIVEPPTATSNAAPVLAQSKFDADAIGTSELASWVSPIVRRVSGTNRPLLIQTADATDGELRAMLSASGFASAVAAPVGAEGQSPLVLVAFSVTPNGFANSDLGFVSSISSILTLARRLRDGDLEAALDAPVGPDLARAQRMAGLGGWELDLTSGALQWSDAAYELFGLSKRDTTPTQELFDSLVDPRDSERLRSSLRETRLNGHPGVIEYRITRADGSPRWLRQEHELVERGSESPRMIGAVHDVTLQRETSDALRHNDERLRAVLNASAIGIAVVEDDGRTVYRNRAYTDLLGYSNEEMEQRTLEEVAAAADRSRISGLRARLAQGETHVELDSPASFVRKDGTVAYLDVSVTRIGAGSGAVRVVNLRDRSQQMTAELQAAEGERRFRSVFETASGGLLLLGSDGLPQTANEAFLEMFGVTAEEISERPPQQFIVSEQHRIDIAECIEKHLRGEWESCQHVMEIRRLNDGAPRQVSVICQTLFDGDEVRGVLAEFTDLTEVTEAQRALQNSERRLREAGEVAKLGHWEWDVEAGEITVSELIAPLFGGITRSDLFYQRYMGMVVPEDRDRVRAASEAAFGRGEPFDLQYTVHPPDGEPMDLHEVLHIEFDESGETIRAFGIVQDVTDRVAAERASAESESRLRAIFDASHNGISFFSDRRTPPLRNRAFAEMLGYTLEETRNLSLGALLPLDEERSWINQLWERVGRGEPAGDLDLKRFVHKDGHLVDVDIRLSDVTVEGNVIGHVADIRDVTSELAQRRALEESETRARLIFETTSSGLLLMRLNGDIQIANQAFCDILGTTINDVSTLKVHRIIDRQDVKPVFELFRARLRGDLTTPPEVSVRLKRLDDGRIRTLRVDARPFVEDGEVAGMLADVRDVSEHTETVRTLEESQARLARAQANARIGGWELDLVTQELRWSEELYRLLGQEPSETPLTIGDLLRGVHQDDRARFIETFEQAQQESSPFDIRLRFAGGDGQLRTVWSRGDLVVDEEGEPPRWEGTTQDITELAEAQQALSASEARLNSAQASAHIGSWSRDLKTGDASWSDELYRLLGMEPGAVEPSRDNFRSFVHADERDAYNDSARDDDLHESYQIQARFVGADQVERMLLVNGELVRDHDGEPMSWTGTAQDVTEQAMAQEALTESESRLNLAQSIAHVGSWGQHLIRGDAYWSDEFYRLLGLEPGAVEPSLGRLLTYMHPDDRARFQEITRNPEDSYNIRVRCIGEDGVERMLWMHGDLTRDQDGTPLSWDGTSQDITELTQAQEALAEGAERLELAQSQAHVGSYGRNLMTDEVYWSDELYRLLGHEPHAIEPSIENLYTALHPDDRDQFRDATREAVRTGTDRYDIQSRSIRPNDEQRVLWQHGELTRDQNGQPLRWDGTVQDVTELVGAQQALTEREEFLRTTLDAVRSGVMVVDPARRIISANGNASEIMGYSADEFLTVRLEDVVHGEDLALMLTRFAARVRGEGGPERTIVRAWKHDGSEVNLDVRGAPLLQSGELRGVVVDFRDVTEELAVQQRLEDTANRLRTLFETVRSGLMVIGPNMVPITCNEAIAEMLGTSSDELLSQSIDVFLLPEERQIVAEAIEARMRDESVPGRIPSAIIRADGVQREVDLRSTPFIVGGETIGILCEVRDITEDLALQREVQDTAERLSNVFETVSTGLIVVGLDQRPLTVNQALCDILNYSRDDLMQKTFSEISHPDDVEFILERFAQRIGGGTPVNRHHSRALRSDGSVIHVDISAEPFRIGGEIVGVLGEVRDITEALALQQEVEHTAERLNTVFESVSTGLAIVGPDRRPVTVNQALCDITGYSREEMLTRPFEQSVHPDDVVGLLQRFEDRLSGEMDQRLESRSRLIARDGSTRDISVSSEPFHIGGRFVGVLAEIRDITQELSLQRQVQETADRLNNVFESVSTGLLVIGPDRNPLTVNQALCDITGYPRETLLSTPIDDLIHHDDLPAVLDRFAKRLAGDRQSHHLQARAIRFDGEVITIDLSAEPFLVGGEVVGVLAEIRDITEDLELQDRVQETADRLNNVFASVSTGLAVVGADRHPQTMNQAFCAIVGLSEEQLADKPFDSLIHPDDLETIRERFERQLLGEDVVPHHINVRVIRGNGQLIDIDLSARPFVIGGKITGVLAEIRDITEELSLQTLVTESAEQINTILEATPDAIVVADDHDMILRVNAAAEKIFGSKTDELIGHPVSDLVGSIDQAAHPSYVEHYKRTGRPSTPEGLVIGSFREATGQRADGSEFPAELAVAETELADGRKLFVAAIRDITERKRAEAQLQTLNSQLEARSHERQALVQQLLSAQEEERRTVAYEIHDGPAQQLAAAQMFLEAFAFDQNIDMEADSADHLQRAKSYLDTGLTETRRIMSGLRPALLDDLGLADALHQLLNELASRAEIQLELDSSKLVDDLSPSVEITLYRIAQEAATNALKHADSDRLRVDLQSDGSVAQLRVADYGRGFDPNEIEGPRGGHRYGLVGMRERVALLEGQFEIDSAPGQGTVITVTIPLSEED